MDGLILALKIALKIALFPRINWTVHILKMCVAAWFFRY